MIDFIQGGLQDIWPEQSPEIQALSYAIQNAIRLVKKKADAARIYASVDNLPENILDYMAVELRTMYYDQGLDIEQKRAIIKNTLKWYAHAGTPATVEEMVEVIFGVGQVVEWFDFTEPPYIPGTFDILTSAILTPDIMNKLNAMLRKAKNTRSHLRRVIIEREIHAGTVVAIRQVAVQETVVLNYIQESKELDAPIYAAAVGAVSRNTYVLNDIHQDAEAGSRQRIALYGSTTATRVTVTNETNGSSEAQAVVYDGSGVWMTSRRATVTNETNGSSEAASPFYGRALGIMTADHTTVTNETKGNCDARQKTVNAQAGKTTSINSTIKEE